MQNIQLYIEGNRMDMFKDESVSLTQTIQNVKDIAKVFTNFTKTFSLPASKGNNKVFEHYYNYDIVNGFDARVKKNSTIELNYLPFEKGKIKLEGVDMKNNKPYAYRITFFGNTIDLKDLLGDDELDALDWLENFTTNYDMNTIKTGLKTGLNFTVDSVVYNDALVVPLITHTERLYYDSVNEVAGDGNLYAHMGTGGQHHHGVYWEQLKYAIRVHLIVKAIEEKYSISFSTDFFNSSNAPYYNLYMWMHRKKGFIDDPNAPEQYTQLVQFGLDNTMTNVEAIAERIIVSNQTGANKITSTLTVRPDSLEDTSYTVTVLKDGQVYDTIVATAPGEASKDIDLVDGTYTVRLAVTEEFTFGELGVENAVDWQLADLQVPESHTFDVTEFTINATKEFSGTAQMPKQKVIDFLTGLFKTYNLTAFKEDDGTIKVQTLDSFYTAGTSYDISEFVDIDSSQINVALPYREIEFKYKGLGTKLALQHEQLAGQGWGTTNFRGGDDEVGEIAGDIYTVESPFEHMKFERLLDAGANFAETDAQVGWCVDDNDDPYLGEPVLFYPIQITNGTEIRFLEGLSSGEEDIDDYWIPSNSVSTNSSTSTANINFNQELNEYSPDESFTGTLFQNYYTTYITDVFKTKRRLSKFKAFLPLKILRNYTLADRFVVNNRSYKINSITTNLGTGESDIELLNEV
jgi:hypothetical protein